MAADNWLEECGSRRQYETWELQLISYIEDPIIVMISA